jgi:hypothetical protein
MPVPAADNQFIQQPSSDAGTSSGLFHEHLDQFHGFSAELERHSMMRRRSRTNRFPAGIVRIFGGVSDKDDASPARSSCSYTRCASRFRGTRVPLDEKLSTIRTSCRCPAFRRAYLTAAVGIS